MTARTSQHTAHKLPQVTALFWVLKIAATTLGESGGDWVSQTLKLGYLAATLIFFGVMVCVLAMQLWVRAFHPVLFWSLIAATSTSGTTLSDLINRGDQSGSAESGLGYPAGAAILISALVVVFVIWKFSGETYNVAHITTRRGELLYWAAIVVSNTLGTSSGDFLSDSSGLGYWGGALLIGGIMAAVLSAHFFTRIPGAILFWVAFVATRPLGATVGDFFTKPTDEGGLGMGTQWTSVVLLVILVCGVVCNIGHNRSAADAQSRDKRVTDPA